MSFYTVVDGHWLSFLRDLYDNLAVIAVIFGPSGSIAPG
jgi:hypothetical protein